MTKTYKEEEDNTICKICKEKYQYLGSHLWHKHHLKSREYKQIYGLDYNYPLMDKKVQDKKRVAFNKHRKKYLKNITNHNQYRFKKGRINRTYFSKQSLIRFATQLDNIPFKKENCPVCNMGFNHLDSHLFNKHKLLRVK